jgi:hypothetical protein
MSSLFINTRDAAMRLLLGGRAVLNPTPYPQQPGAGLELVTEIKRAMNTFKAEAMDEAGHYVDYARLRDSDTYQRYRTTLTPQLRILDLATLQSRNQQLAFWINLYNALVIDAVINYEVKDSVTEGFIGSLTFFRSAAYNVAGRRFSCEDIEHGILRSNMGNPFIPGAHFESTDPRCAWIIAPLDVRIHFALNCASLSCPPIGVYDPENLDAQLDMAASNFIANDVAVDTGRNEVSLSQIFNWYKGDFGGYQGILDFLLRYLPDDERRQWLKQQPSVNLAFRPYDWSLPRLT